MSSLFQQQLNKQFSLIAQSLASSQRLEILYYLSQAQRSVDELSKLTKLSVANTSRHLQILKQYSLVTVNTQGQQRFYNIKGNDIIKLLDALKNTAKTHLAEVEKLTNIYLNKKETLEQVSASELLEKINHNEVVILDVRPEKEFLSGHLPNAINIPPDEIAKHIKTLSNKKMIVAYCRGDYCLYSYKAVKLLLENGFNAKQLENGFPEWKAKGYPFH